MINFLKKLFYKEPTEDEKEILELLENIDPDSFIIDISMTGISLRRNPKYFKKENENE